MAKILMNKADKVNVWMVQRNIYGEVNDKCLIATFRNRNWAEAFVSQELMDRPETYSDYCELTIE